MRKRFDLKTEIFLALLPTLTIAAVLFLLETYSKQRLLFGSLASSAFLIYLDPKLPSNSIYTLSVAQVSSALIGFCILKLIGSGYTSALLAMIISIAFMIVFNVMHPPAVSTALTFAFESGKALPLFLIALALLVILIVLEKVSLWVINKSVPADPVSKL